MLTANLKTVVLLYFLTWVEEVEWDTHQT